jgi:hypothetical protein
MSDDKEFPLAPVLAVKLVTPNGWDEICRDRFVFGWVVAVAFSYCQRLRVTRDGLVFETDDFTDERLAEIGGVLDEESERAIRAQSGLMHLKSLFNATNSVVEFGGRRGWDDQ